jgi:chromosome segregation ATPase
MTSDSPQLRGALFGFRRASVRQLLAGRETMFRFAQERAQAAEAKAEELQAELKTAQAELVTQTEAAESAHAETRAELQEAVEALREQTERVATLDAALSELQAELAARSELVRSGEARIVALQGELEVAQAALDERAGEPRKAQMAEAEDLSLMLDAAERGVTGIMERARQAYEDQLAQTEAVRETIQADIERFGDWQGRVEPLIRSVQQGIETARGRIMRIPDQIREAVDSMTDAMMAVSESLDRLATLPGPLSMNPLPDLEGSLGTVADTVVHLKESEPEEHVTVVPPSNVSRTDDEEAEREARPDAKEMNEDRAEPSQTTSWMHQRNRGH